MRVRWERDDTRKGFDWILFSFSFFAHQRLTNAFFFFFQPRSTKNSKKTERLDELRALNRKTFEETGEYMTEEEIRAFRQPRWTDRREFQDDD